MKKKLYYQILMFKATQIFISYIFCAISFVATDLILGQFF